MSAWDWILEKFKKIWRKIRKIREFSGSVVFGNDYRL